MTAMSWGTDLWVGCALEASRAAVCVARTRARPRGVTCGGLWSREVEGRARSFNGCGHNEGYIFRMPKCCTFVVVFIDRARPVSVYVHIDAYTCAYMLLYK